MCPLYDTLGEEAVKFCLNQTELSILFVNAKTIDTYLGYLSVVQILSHYCLVVLYGPDIVKNTNF